MISVFIGREQPDRLHKQTWCFGLDGGQQLRLRVYQRFVRDTPRDEYRLDAYYWRDLPQTSSITAADVPLPDDVRAEALERLVAQIVVSK